MLDDQICSHQEIIEWKIFSQFKNILISKLNSRSPLRYTILAKVTSHAKTPIHFCQICLFSFLPIGQVLILVLCDGRKGKIQNQQTRLCAISKFELNSFNRKCVDIRLKWWYKMLTNLKPFQNISFRKSVDISRKMKMDLKALKDLRHCSIHSIPCQKLFNLNLFNTYTIIIIAHHHRHHYHQHYNCPHQTRQLELLHRRCRRTSLHHCCHRLWQSRQLEVSSVVNINRQIQKT